MENKPQDGPLSGSDKAAYEAWGVLPKEESKPSLLSGLRDLVSDKIHEVSRKFKHMDPLTGFIVGGSLMFGFAALASAGGGLAASVGAAVVGVGAIGLGVSEIYKGIRSLQIKRRST